MRRCSAFGLLPMVLATLSVAGSVKVGWREIDGINVSSGSVTQTTPVVIGFGGTFAKSGVGELKLSMAQMNSSFSNNVEVLDGTLALSPGIDTTVDLLHPPAVFSKAAYWCAADSTNLITEMDGGKTRVSKWCDVRTALVYQGELDPQVKEDGYFSALIDAETLLRHLRVPQV